MHIPKEAPLKAKIKKLVAGVRDARREVARVQFELNLKITKLEVGSQPSTLPEGREQHEATIKDIIATVDVVVVDCTTLFEQAMEVVTTLQEDPNLQRLKTETHELLQQYDEVQATTCTVAIAQHLAKLQEGKKLLTQVEVV